MTRDSLAVCRLLAGLMLVLVLGACATPSVHPIYTESTERDALLDEPGLVGTWKGSDSSTTYTVTRVPNAYGLVAATTDEKRPDRWEFDVRLVQIGEHRFADFSVNGRERDALQEKWGPLLVPTHLFARWDLEGDALTLWLLKRDWFEKAVAGKAVTLTHTAMGKDSILISAPTADLQAFLRKHGGDPDAFADQVKLRRVKP
jgi:hypothetical protein